MNNVSTFPQPSARIGSSSRQSDEALIAAVAAGDEDAMRVLFGRHNVRIFRFVTRLVGDASLAEDIVSEVFVDVWRQASQFEGRSQVSTWILSIARFKALSERRRRHDAELDDNVALSIADQGDTPEEAVLKSDRSDQLRLCLTQLSREHREIVDLVYYHEKTIEEVAEIIQAPRNTIKTRMFYARKRLAQLLAAHQDFKRNAA
jgi:RNA polymerase sigma-70 factor (ECF subfamily)